jgi:hypothetical protein
MQRAFDWHRSKFTETFTGGERTLATVPARPFTTFAVGPDLAAAFASAEVPSTHGSVESVVVPADANPSKVCTYVQKAVLDPVSLTDVPPELRALVESTAGRLTDDPTLVLGVDMAGNPMGDKMRQRLSPDDDTVTPFLLFGIAQD